MTTKQISATRVIISRVLLLTPVPLVAIGLIDPLEGGISLLIAGAVYLIAFLVSGDRPKKILWVPYLVAVLLGATQLILAFTLRALTEPGSNPIFPLAIGNWVYRAAVLVLLVGAIITAVAEFKKTR